MPPKTEMDQPARATLATISIAKKPAASYPVDAWNLSSGCAAMYKTDTKGSTSPKRNVKIVAIADTHGRHRQLELPDGDLLIHCGDITGHGTPAEVREFNEWLGSLPHRAKIVIAGNHDEAFEYEPEQARKLITNAVYLEDSETSAFGFRIYGSPYQPEFNSWHFNLPRGEALRAKWALIPDGIDILVTHGPPCGILDQDCNGMHLGCADLMTAVDRRHPSVHLFGHVHEGYGVVHSPKTIFANASVLDRSYQIANRAVVLRIPAKR